MNRNQQDILSYINKAKMDNELKKMFSMVLNALQQEQEETLDNLEDRFRSELITSKTKWDDIWNIRVYLAEDEYEVEQMKQQGFQIIDFGNSVFIKPLLPADADINRIPNAHVLDNIKKGFMFFDGSYEDFLSFLQKDAIYSGHFVLNDKREIEFKYRVKPNYRIVRQEAILHKIANLYNIQKPIVFSPYARRAVDIEILLDQDQDFNLLKLIVQTDLKLKENQLEMLKEGFQLMWNISVINGNAPDSEGDTDGAIIALDGNQNRYVYIYRSGIGENDFVYPLAQLEHPDILKSKNEIQFICKDKINQYNFKKMSIFNGSVAKYLYSKEFCNSFKSGIQNVLRLSTVGDIQYVLAQFVISDGTDKIFWCDFGSMNDCEDKGLILTRYIPEHDYWEDREQLSLQKIKNRPFCYVKFACKESQSKFLTDYANYVLHYLNCNYPEYCWAGVQA